MSTFEFVFFKTELAPQQAAMEIANALEMEVVQKNRKIFIRSSNSYDTNGTFGGSLGENIYDSSLEDVEDIAPYDGYPLVWEIKHTSAGEDAQIAISREIFWKLTRTVGWPCILVHNLDLVLASWDPERGSREFPPGTSIDSIDRHIWG